MAVAKMNTLTDEPLLDPVTIRGQIEARDLQMANPFAKDAQVQGIRNARRYLRDRIGPSRHHIASSILPLAHSSASNCTS